MKKYVDVITKHNRNGAIIPLKIIWEDGASYEITRVTDIRPAASLKAGGVGIRYTCVINRQTKYLFLEENRWFVES